MSVIIRLQNLPWSANALDIRQYFHGLSIPEGGVHIVGGELGDAFIAFSTDEDARQAFQRNNGKIKEVQITLHLSSRTEMQKVIEAARNIQTPFMAQPAVVPKPAIVPPVATIQPNINQDLKKDELSDSSKKDDRSKKSNRRRTRSRSRSRERDRKDRDRSRERSRDRRDRRRRDRSRSRDRRDKRRDRRDRSKSRERTRSKDRDSRRSREGRDKPRPKSSEKNDDNSNHSSQSTNNEVPKRINPWERNVPQRQPQAINNGNNQNQNSGLLGKFPMINSLEEARRSLNMISGMQSQAPALQTNQTSLVNQQQDNLRNPMLRNWQMENKSQSIPDRPILDSKQSLGALFQQVQQQRPIMSNNRPMGMYQSNLGNPRPGFNPDMQNNFNNRPFMNRPGMSDMIQPSRNSPDYTLKNDDFRNREYRKDTKEESSENNCIQLRPYWGGYGDLRRFFHGLFISNTGIKVLRESNGKRNGIVYIKFMRPESRQIALGKNGLTLKGYNVEITEMTNEEFDSYGMKEEEEGDMADNELTNVKKPFTCLVVEDIPTFAKEHDMLKMFSDYSLLGIDIQSQNRKRYAYIQFNKEEDAKKALEETGKHILGGKQLNVKACPERNFQDPIIEIGRTEPPLEEPIEIEDDLQIKEDHPENVEQPDMLEDNNDQSASFDTDVILMSRMPPKTSERDIIDFFSDIGLVPINVHMITNKFGPTGECYCEFSSPDEVVSALDKNGMPLGNNMITVEPFPRCDMEEHLGFISNTPQPSNFDRFGRGPKQMMPMGAAMGFPRPQMNKMMNFPRFDNMVPHDPNMLPPGCVVAMRNVPYKAGVEEILNFFRNFDINHQSVMRRYNDSGNPTGDARVTFNSPQEAKRAFEECKFKKIRDRVVYLSIL